MMQVDLNLGLTWASVITAIFAAFFWLWASRIRIPDLENSVIGSAFSPMQKASKLNAYAAGFAGVSALLQAALMMLSE